MGLQPIPTHQRQQLPVHRLLRLAPVLLGTLDSLVANQYFSLPWQRRLLLAPASKLHRRLVRQLPLPPLQRLQALVPHPAQRLEQHVGRHQLLGQRQRQGNLLNQLRKLALRQHQQPHRRLLGTELRIEQFLAHQRLRQLMQQGQRQELEPQQQPTGLRLQAHQAQRRQGTLGPKRPAQLVLQDQLGLVPPVAPVPQVPQLPQALAQTLAQAPAQAAAQARVPRKPQAPPVVQVQQVPQIPQVPQVLVQAPVPQVRQAQVPQVQVLRLLPAPQVLEEQVLLTPLVPLVPQVPQVPQALAQMPRVLLQEQARAQRAHRPLQVQEVRVEVQPLAVVLVPVLQGQVPRPPQVPQGQALPALQVAQVQLLLAGQALQALLKLVVPLQQLAGNPSQPWHRQWRQPQQQLLVLTLVPSTTYRHCRQQTDYQHPQPRQQHRIVAWEK